ncbi:MAG: hypothetical protein HQM06_01480 [Magnetococcales bacterium]|nr:hypothetical protein [Magnetococcales bacterium]
MKLPQSLGVRLLLGIWFAGLLLLSAFYFLAVEARQIHREAMEDHFFMNFLNTVLETRRYEKSYFQFHNKHDWENALNYLDQVDRQLRVERKSFLERINGSTIHANLTKLTNEYREKLLQTPRLLENDPKLIHDLELVLHQNGRQFLTIAEQLASDTKNDISAALQHSYSVIFYICCLWIAILIAASHFVWKRVHSPINRLRNQLLHTIEGDLQPISSFDDQEWQRLLEPINYLISCAERGKSRHTAGQQQAMVTTLLLPFSKTLAQPMANLSTTCQILLEEENTETSASRSVMLLQLRHLAEQSNRIVATIQQHALLSLQPFTTIQLQQWLHKVLAQQHLPLPALQAWQHQLDQDINLHGNPALLELVLVALLQHAVHRSPPAALQSLSVCRQHRATLFPEATPSQDEIFYWLPEDAQEVILFTLPLASELADQPSWSTTDLPLLFLPQAEENPALCLLPEIVRLHNGFLRVEPWQPSWLRLQIGFPLPGKLLNQRPSHPYQGTVSA